MLAFRRTLKSVNAPDFSPLSREPAVERRWRSAFYRGSPSRRRRFLKQMNDHLAAYREQFDSQPFETRELWSALAVELEGAVERYVRQNAAGAAVCARCRGACCAQDLGGGVLSDPADLLRFALSDIELDRFVSDRQQHGCCFRGVGGCALPPKWRPRRCLIYSCFRVKRHQPFKALDELLIVFDRMIELPLLGADYSFADLVRATGLPEDRWKIRYHLAVAITDHPPFRIFHEARFDPESPKLQLLAYPGLNWPGPPGTRLLSEFDRFNREVVLAPAIYDQNARETFIRAVLPLHPGELPTRAIAQLQSAVTRSAIAAIHVFRKLGATLPENDDPA